MHRRSSVGTWGKRPFPTTRWSLLRDAADASSNSFRDSAEEFARLYWSPVYSHLRRKWGLNREDARDLAQDFFAGIWRKDSLRKIARGHARFRTYVMTALDNLAVSLHRHKQRIKRGGGVAPQSLEAAEGVARGKEGEPDRLFLKDWAMAVLSDALKELKATLRERDEDATFEMLRLRDVEGSSDSDRSYQALSHRFGVSVTDVANRLRRARQMLRELVELRVVDTVAGAEEADQEIRELFDSMSS